MKQINYRKHGIGKKKLGKGLRGYKGGTGIPTGAFGGKSKFLKKKLDTDSWSAILEGMNYCQEQLEYLEWQAQAKKEKDTNPCDLAEGVYMLVDDASPSESPLYFRSLKGAVDWAENDNQYISYQGVEQWSVYRVGGKVL